MWQYFNSLWKICLQERIQGYSDFFLQGRIILAPLFYVNFADFWLADQLNSLVVVFVDFQYFICFYLTNDNWMAADGKKLDLIVLLHCMTYVYNWCIMFCVQLFDRYKCLCWLYSNNTSIGRLSASMVEICTVSATLQRHKGSFSSSCECGEVCHFIPCYVVQHNECDIYRFVTIAAIKIFSFHHFYEQLEWTRSNICIFCWNKTARQTMFMFLSVPEMTTEFDITNYIIIL